jgi:hypothetical protein
MEFFLPCISSFNSHTTSKTIIKKLGRTRNTDFYEMKRQVHLLSDYIIKNKDTLPKLIVDLQGFLYTIDKDYRSCDDHIMNSFSYKEKLERMTEKEFIAHLE